MIRNMKNTNKNELKPHNKGNVKLLSNTIS